MEAQNRNLEKILKVLFLFILVLKVLESFVLTSHGDALSYHLVFPKFIIENGFFEAHKKFFLAAQAGFFDYIYLIPQLIFGSGMVSQSLSQFIHFSSSILLSLFFLNDLFSDRESRLPFYLCGLCFLTFNRSADFFIYAKNDGFLAFNFLVATSLIFDFFPKNRKIYFWVIENKYFVIGFLLGFLPTIKMNGLIYTGVLYLFFVYKKRKNINAIIMTTIIATLTCSTVFLRNWLMVKNPTFPAFMELFPTNATPEMIKFHNSMLNVPASLTGILKNFLIAFTPKNLFFLFPLLILKNYREDRISLNVLPLIIFLFTTLYCLRNPGYAAVRFYFGCHFVLLLFLGLSLQNVSFKNPPQAKTYLFIMIALILADSKIDKSVKRISHFYWDLLSRIERQDFLIKYVPHAIFWEKVEPNSNIASDKFPMQYYAPKNTVLYQAGNAKEANFFISCQKHQNSPSFQYFLLVRPLTGCFRDNLDINDAIVKTSQYALFKVNGL